MSREHPYRDDTSFPLKRLSLRGLVTRWKRRRTENDDEDRPEQRVGDRENRGGFGSTIDDSVRPSPEARSSDEPVAPRHCMVVYAYYPLGETRVQRQAEILVSSGYAVDVVCLRNEGEPPHDTYRGVEIHRLGQQIDKRSLIHQLMGYVKFTIRAGVRLTKMHRRAPYRSVQVHNLPDFLVFSALVPKLKRVPVILDLHDLMPEFFAGRFGTNRRSLACRLIVWQERLACRFADHVITVSDHWKQALVERGVSGEKVTVVLNVADETIFTPRPAKPAREFRLVYHGTVTRRYGLDLAVDAVASVRDLVPDVRLLIIGEGDLMPELFRLRRELGLEDVVELRDELVLAEDLPDLLCEANAAVVPYRDDVFTDGLLPTKLMEYAAMSIPSIAARTTAIEGHFQDTMVEFFEPGNSADLARCILKLYSDPAYLADLALQSQKFVQRHNWRTIGARFVELVGQLSAEHG